MLDRQAQAVVRRTTAARFASVCVAYFVMWLIMRERRADGPADNPTAAARS